MAADGYANQPTQWAPALKPTALLGGGGTLIARAALCLVLAFAGYGIPLVLGEQFGDAALTATAILAIAIPTIALIASSIRLYSLYLLCLVVIQNGAVGLWLSDTMTGVPLVVTESKTVSVAIAILLSLGHLGRFLKQHRPILIAILLYIAWVLVSVRDPSVTALAYGRNFLFPILLCLLIAARTRDMPERERLDLLRQLVYVTLSIMAVGVFVEALVGGATWRELLNVNEIASLGGSVSTDTDFLGITFTRFAGIVIEPTNAGYIAAACAALILVIYPHVQAGRLALGLFFILAVVLLVLSAAKSGLLMLFPAIASVLIGRARGKPSTLLFLNSAAGFLIVFAYLVTVKGVGATVGALTSPLSIIGGDSTTYHFAGLISGVTEGVRTVLGAGLGVGGNFSTSLADDEEASLSGSLKVATGGESAWGVLSYQTGIIGLILLVVVLVVLCNTWGTRSAIVLSVWSVSAMFAEAIFGVQVAAILMIGAALVRDPEKQPESGLAEPALDTGSSIRRERSRVR